MFLRRKRPEKFVETPRRGVSTVIHIPNPGRFRPAIIS